MEVNFTVSDSLPVKAVSASGNMAAYANEPQDARDKRIVAFFADATNAVLWLVGFVLAIRSNALQGASIAQYLVSVRDNPSVPKDGEVSNYIALKAIPINGQLLPLRPEYKLSLRDMKVWGCLGCGSAHGSAQGSSKSKGAVQPNASALETNRFVYNPRTQELYTISATCWQKYILGLRKDKASGKLVQAFDHAGKPYVSRLNHFKEIPQDALKQIKELAKLDKPAVQPQDKPKTA